MKCNGRWLLLALGYGLSQHKGFPWTHLYVWLSKLTDGAVLGVAGTEIAGHAGLAKADLSHKAVRSYGLFCGIFAVTGKEVSCNEIIMATGDRTSRLPLVQGWTVRAIPSSLDARGL